jgi:hypothetical protein
VKGEREGVLAEVMSEAGLNSDTPQVVLAMREGRIASNLDVEIGLSSLISLAANTASAFQGFKPYGLGFILQREAASELLKNNPSLSSHILPYLNGRDVAQRPRDVFAIDFNGLTLSEIRQKFPTVLQHLLETVKPERDHAKMDYRRKNWWLFGQPSTETRSALTALARFIVTPETAKHRYFLTVQAGTLPDQKLRVISVDSAPILAVLSCRLHVTFAEAQGNWQGAGNDPVYTHAATFDPFPFPLAVDPTLKPSDPLFAQQERLRELGERLDAFRKQRLAEHDFLTMTGLYNALERLRELENGIGEPLTAAERDVHEAG